MTDPTEAEVLAAAKVIDPIAWSDIAAQMWSPDTVEVRQREARRTARDALKAAAEVRKSGLMPIYSTTEDQGEDVLGYRPPDGE